MVAHHVPTGMEHKGQAVESLAAQTPKLLDLVHLSCQTFGDPELERDVLLLFLDQIESTGSALRAASTAIERRRLYHLVKGSARGVGAFQLAALAECGETAPQNHAHLAATLSAIEAVSVRVDELLAI